MSNALIVNADELDDKLNQQQQIQNELDNINGSISDAQEDLENATEELEQLEEIQAIKEAEKQQQITELEELQKTILSIDEEVAVLQEEYDEKESLFLERAKIMYQYSDYSMIDLFFQSENIFVFFENIDLYKKMLEEDKTLLEEVSAMQDNLLRKKELQENTFADKEILLEEIESAISDIESDKTLAAENYQALTDVFNQLAEEENRLSAEADNLQGDIEYLTYLKEKEAAEAAAKAQAEAEAAAKAQAEAEEKNKATAGTENNSEETPTVGATDSSSSDYSDSDNSYVSAGSSSSGYIFPLASYVYMSSPYGYRTHPITGVINSFHTGMDLAASGGTPIYAAADGVVTVSTVNGGGYGQWIEIEHSDGSRTRYAHCSALYVSVGDTVSQGQTIAAVGMTGSATGNHLHFEVYMGGERVDPAGYISLA